MATLTILLFTYKVVNNSGGVSCSATSDRCVRNTGLIISHFTSATTEMLMVIQGSFPS